MPKPHGVRFQVDDMRSFPCSPGCILRAGSLNGSYRRVLPRGYDPEGPHAFVQITLSGQGIVTPTGGQAQTAPRGRCLVASMGDHLVYESGAQGWDFVFFNLMGPVAATWITSLTQRHGHVLRCEPDHHLVEHLLTQCGDGVDIQAMQLAAGARLASDLLVALDAWNEPTLSPEQSLVQQACNILTSALCNPPSISQVAHQCGVSREHLTRVFSSQRGQSPARWLRNERLHHAALLLRTSSQSIGAIASEVGFENPTSFGTAFRSMFNCSPSTYRKQG